MMIFYPRNVPYVIAIRRCKEIGFTMLDFYRETSDRKSKQQ